MQRKHFIAAATAAALGLASALATAQPRDRDQERQAPSARQQGHGNDARGHKPQAARQAGPQGQARGHQAQHAKGPQPHAHAQPGRPDSRGAGPDHRFHRGDRLPADWRGRNYQVDDWRGHHLSAPPRGHRWVQVGADYVLVAIATGVIAQIILSQ